MEISNQQIAKILKNVAAAYTIKKIGNFFQIRAYENAADSIEHSTAEMQDLWQEGKLDSIPGLGKDMRDYLNELFKEGKVKHFEQVEKGIPKVVFDLLDISGIGPKTAQKIAELGIKDIDSLKKKIKSGELVKKGFSSKIAQNIMKGLHEAAQKGNRMLLPYAAVQADKIINYLKKNKDVIQVDTLGSLRRMVATVGDLDFSVSSNKSASVIDHFCKMPDISRVLDKGESKASAVLKSGVRVDLLVSHPDSYGALLQHFTGSKNHNIHLRTYAQSKGYSLSEFGVKNAGGKLIKTETEKEFYNLLKMDVPPPEIREDTGEIEAALKHDLPKFLNLEEIKGDLHLHSNFPIEKPSHGPGVDSIEEIVKKAKELRYSYAGISDHSPSFNLSKDRIGITIEKRTNFIQSLKKRTNGIRVLNGLEIDILGDGSLSVPDEFLETLDYVIAGIHSGHRGEKDVITKRLISALNNPNVDIISHPTNRLLNERDSSEADWEEIFKLAAKNNKILEINAYYNRLDLRDDLVRQAKKYGVKFIINTDAHQIEQMDNMRFGVSVARRGWAEKEDIVNSWDWKKFSEWFRITS